MNVIKAYIDKCRNIADKVEEQQTQIANAANWFAQSILAGRVVHVFGSGHSRIMVEEMWPRYGSFPGFNPIVELSLTYHNNVVGANGQRQAMFFDGPAELRRVVGCGRLVVIVEDTGLLHHAETRVQVEFVPDGVHDTGFLDADEKLLLHQPSVSLKGRGISRACGLPAG